MIHEDAQRNTNDIGSLCVFVDYRVFIVSN